jgi:hypothetical protein
MKIFNKNIIGNVLLFLFCAIVLALSLRGVSGSPTAVELNSNIWKENGPLELSPERGRYALLYSMAENKTFAFPADIARFAAPDVGYTGSHYASLFAPGVSFIALPGYLIGKFFGFAQVGSFAIIALFAIANVFLLRAIAVRLGAYSLAATIASIAFIFGSPAFTYATTLYQHHISTFLILASVYLLIRFNSFFSLFLIWMLCGFSISVDYPNFFMMLPIGVFALYKTVLFKKENGIATIKISLLRVFAVVGLILPMVFFLWFNQMSNGSPLQLSGGLQQIKEVKANGEPAFQQEIQTPQKRLVEQNYEAQQSILSFFWNRNMINGVYSHFFSPDRGMIFYTPVMFLGIVGIIIALGKKQKYVGLLTAIIGFNIILYSMWGDPYGGWAFGSRYLIPTYALLAVYLAIALTYLKKYNLFLLLFFILFSYSISVNTLGAVTSSRNPPQVETLELERQSGKEEPYTYQRNIDLLNKNLSKSFIYQTYARSYLSVWEYYVDMTVFIIIITASLILAFKVKKEETR